MIELAVHVRNDLSFLMVLGQLVIPKEEKKLTTCLIPHTDII